MLTMMKIFKLTALSISEVRRADEFGALADRHLRYSIIPTSDHFSFSDLELERLSAGS